MMRQFPLLACPLLGLLMLFLIGCGGGGSLSGGGGGGNGGGSALFTMDWSNAANLTRAVPISNANSVRITCGLQTQIITRPDTRATFTGVPVGTQGYTISAYASTNGTGTPLGTAQGTLLIARGDEARCALTTDTADITELTIAGTLPGQSLAVQVGKTLQLGATVRTDEGAVVLLAGSQLEWETTTPDIASVTSSGLVTGITAGAAAITATVRGTTVSDEATVTVQTTQVSTVHYRFIANSPDHSLLKVLFRDGAGAWTVAQETAANTFTGQVTDADGRYSFAVATSVNNATRVTYYHATLAEMTEVIDGDAFRAIEPAATGNTVMLSGMLQHTTGYSWAAIYFGRNQKTVSLVGSQSPYTMDVQPGTHDLIVLYGIGESTDEQRTISGAMVIRNCTISGSDTRNLDLALGRTIAKLSVSGLPAGKVTYSDVDLYTENGTLVNLHSRDTASYCALPATLRAADDCYKVEYDPDNMTAGNVDVETYFTTPTALSLTVPSGRVTNSAANGRTLSWTPPTSIFEHYWLSLGQGNQYWNARVTTGWLDGESSYTFPIITGVTGWSTVWNPRNEVTASGGEVEAVRYAPSFTEYQTVWSSFRAGQGYTALDGITVTSTWQSLP